MRQRQIAAQIAHVNSDCHGDGAQFFEGRIALASFHPADVAGSGLRFQREVLLGQPFGFARLSNPFPQDLQRSCFSQREQRPPAGNFPSSHYSDELGLPSLWRKIDLRSDGAGMAEGLAQRLSAHCLKSMAHVLGESGRYVRDQVVAKRRMVLLLCFLVVAFVSLVEGVILGRWLFPVTMPGRLSILVMFGLLAIILWAFRAATKRITLLEIEGAAMKRGAEGESVVGRILDKFPDGYFVINDLTTPYGNLDHVVVGPTGVFMIDAKNWRGVVASDGRGELLLNGKPTDKPSVRPFIARVMGIREKVMLIAPGRDVFYGPVFVFTSARVDAKWGMTGTVTCVRDEQLYEYIVERKSGTRLQNHDVERIAQALLAVARMDKDFGVAVRKASATPVGSQ
jgi:hypothetical protein